MMKRTRLIAFLFNLYSVSAVAGYECGLKLAHTENLNETIAEKIISIENKHMIAGSFGVLFTELKKGRRKTTLEVSAVMSGWEGEEDAALVILRRVSKRKSSTTETLSEKVQIKGNNSVTEWFDSYKLDVNCRVTE